MKKKTSCAILSAILWGSGQFFLAKRRVRGLLFFAAQLLLFGGELLSGYWSNWFAGQIPSFDIGTYGGVFTRGIWGLVTLGTTPGVGGDHSTLLLINGILVLLALLAFLGIYVWNIRDAVCLGRQLDETGRVDLAASGIQRRRAFPYLTLLPIGILVALVVLMPIIFSVLTAFTNYDANHMPPAQLVSWVGLSNFVKLMSVPVWAQTFWGVLAWTIVWAVCATFSTYFLGLFQAMVLNSRCVKHRGFFQTIYILPWAVPGMISLLVFRNLLNGQFGPLNQFLMDCHLISQRIPFLTDPVIAKVSIILVNLWLGFPQFMVMLLGVMSNQDTNLYEAAAIDGANRFQTFAHIKLPLLTHATAPLIVMNLAGNFNAFGSIYFLTGGGPSDPAYQFAGDTDILISWIYKLTLDQRMYSMAAVMNILIFIFIAVVSVWNFRRTSAFKEM